MSQLLCGYESYILKEDYDQGMVWDNEPVGVIMNRIWREAMIKKGLRTQEEYDMQEMPTEELPIVEPEPSSDLDETAELPIVGQKEIFDTDKTAELPIVNPQKAKVGFFHKIANIIKNSIIAFKNRRNPQLSEGHNGEQVDRSGYYAQIAIQSSRKTFDERYAVKPENLAPLNFSDTPKEQKLRGREDDKEIR